MNRLPIELQQKYEKTQLDRVEIDGITLQGYFEYSFLEEKSYAENPTRSDDGSIVGLEDMRTFLTPRLIIKYNMMDIEDYRTLMKLIKSKNTFIVTCYDIVEDKRVTHEMYFAPPSMPVIYQQYLMALGVQDFAIELIGTNTDPFVNINYIFNFPDEVSEEYYVTSGNYTVSASKYEKYTIIQPNVTAYNKTTQEVITVPLQTLVRTSQLVGFNTNINGTGTFFQIDQSYWISTSTTLFAMWD